jgi:hypothetical protein
MWLALHQLHCVLPSSLCTCLSKGLGCFSVGCFTSFQLRSHMCALRVAPGHSFCASHFTNPYRSPVRSDQKSRQAHPIYLGSFTCMRLLASLCCMYSALAARILPQEANRIRPNGPPVAPAHIKPNPVLPCGRLTCVLHRCPACVPQASFYERPHAVGSSATLQHARLTPPRCPLCAAIVQSSACLERGDRLCASAARCRCSRLLLCRCSRLWVDVVSVLVLRFSCSRGMVWWLWVVFSFCITGVIAACLCSSWQGLSALAQHNCGTQVVSLVTPQQRLPPPLAPCCWWLQVVCWVVVSSTAELHDTMHSMLEH